jgi:hypothetical protein
LTHLASHFTLALINPLRPGNDSMKKSTGMMWLGALSLALGQPGIFLGIELMAASVHLIAVGKSLQQA